MSLGTRIASLGLLGVLLCAGIFLHTCATGALKLIDLAATPPNTAPNTAKGDRP